MKKVDGDDLTLDGSKCKHHNVMAEVLHMGQTVPPFDPPPYEMLKRMGKGRSSSKPGELKCIRKEEHVKQCMPSSASITEVPSAPMPTLGIPVDTMDTGYRGGYPCVCGHSRLVCEKHAPNWMRDFVFKWCYYVNLICSDKRTLSILK